MLAGGEISVVPHDHARRRRNFGRTLGWYFRLIPHVRTGIHLRAVLRTLPDQLKILDYLRLSAWNLQASIDLTLGGPKGQVYALIVGNDTLFAGTEVWDLATLQCTHTLTGHESVVMSLLCWDQYLLSCSLDGTVKVRAGVGTGTTVRQRLEDLSRLRLMNILFTRGYLLLFLGVLALNGVNGAHAKRVLMCSCNDNVVRVYDLPSFNERGRIFSKEGVRALEIGPGGLSFTGDGAGELKVWKLFSN